MGLTERVRGRAWIEILRRYRRRRSAGQSRNVQRRRFPHVDRTDLPIVFGNAMAKSGSHLLEQFLEGLPEVCPLAFTAAQPIRTIAPEGRRRPDGAVMGDLAGLKAGDIAWGYLPSREPFYSLLTQQQWVSFFIYRDPRDRLVSHILYATDLHPRHAMKAYYLELPNMETRIDATIEGVPGLLPGVTEAYGSYRGWLASDKVLGVRYEDLINHRREAVDRMIRHLGQAGVAFLGDRQTLRAVFDQAMSPARSLTYRAGVTGAWRQYFTKANIAHFKEATGDLLQLLGYEKDEDW
jgi:hypothetical protein